jgi:RNA polymerase sigma-70 factor (ECF subfamily)
MKGLDPVLGAAYRLRVADGLSYEEIAEELDIPRATVGTRLLRARKKLRAILKEQLEHAHG